jgi:hypothetical protein
VPARPYRPRDKAKVEVGVQIAERWIIAALRHHKFFRLEEVNRAVRELLERLNQRPFRKREGSRSSVFASLERCALRSLPVGTVIAINSECRSASSESSEIDGKARKPQNHNS